MVSFLLDARMLQPYFCDVADELGGEHMLLFEHDTQRLSLSRFIARLVLQGKQNVAHPSRWLLHEQWTALQQMVQESLQWLILI